MRFPFYKLLTTHYKLPATRGQSILEIIVAIGIFVLLASNVLVLYLSSFSAYLHDKEKFQADMYLQQGLEAVRSIRDYDFQTLMDGTYGLSRSSGYWEFLGNSDVRGQFTRTVSIESVRRNGSCMIVPSGGNIDANSKKVTVNISWSYETGNAASFSASEYMHNRYALAQCGMSQSLVINTANAEVDTNNRDLEEITIQNNSSEPIIIDKIIISWTGSSALIEQVRIAEGFVWRYDFEGSPDGRQPSGTELDVLDYTIPANSEAIKLDRLRFDGNITNSSFTFIFKMIDGSTITANAL